MAPGFATAYRELNRWSGFIPKPAARTDLEKLSAAAKAMDLRIEQIQKSGSYRGPSEGLSALVDRAPQAEAFGRAHSGRELRPASAWLYASRRRLATVGVARDHGLAVSPRYVWRQWHGGVPAKARRLSKPAPRNRPTAEGKQPLHRPDPGPETDPKTIEKEAREQLHYARPGEVVYVAPAPPPVQIPSTNAAQK